MPRDPRNSRAQRIHQLGLKLIALAAIAAATFIVTNAFALERRHAWRQDAASLDVRGETALAAGHASDAVDALRLATTRDRENDRYTLALARALTANGQRDDAMSALLALRERLPDNPEVNLELARLAAAAQQTDDALRYYRYALYAPWPDPNRPREVRYELVRFLLDHGDRTRAVSELIAARVTVGDDAASRVELGRLFLRADDPSQAFVEFKRALATDPNNAEARRLAGVAAYQAGDYEAAFAYLLTRHDDDPSVTAMRSTAASVLRDDPLAPRLSPAEREARMERLLARASARVAACGVPAPDGSQRDELEQNSLSALAGSIRRSHGRDTEALEAALDVAYDAVSSLSSASGECPAADPGEQALLIIGRRHQAGLP